MIDQLDVALVLFTRDAIPDFRRIDQVGFGLLDERRDFLEALDDVLESSLDRRVVQDERVV